MKESRSLLAGLLLAGALCACTTASPRPSSATGASLAFDEISADLFARVAAATPGVTWSAPERVVLGYAIPIKDRGAAPRKIPAHTVEGSVMVGTTWNPSMFDALDTALLRDGWVVDLDVNVDAGVSQQWGYQKISGTSRRFLIFAIDASTTTAFYSDVVENP